MILLNNYVHIAKIKSKNYNCKKSVSDLIDFNITDAAIFFKESFMANPF